MAEHLDATGFTNVDESQESGDFSISLLHSRTGIDGEREVKELVLALLRLKPGLTVLDLGCGTGEDAREVPN